MLPISFKFVALGAGNQAKGALYRFSPARTGEAPNWDNRGGVIAGNDVVQPITDKSYWEGRYALCEVTFQKQDGERLVMNDAIVAVTMQKSIVATGLVGRNGTIKEYINDGDYQINILVGVAAIQNGVQVDEYPSEGIRQLRAFLDEQATIDVYSEFFSLFDIDSIVITGFQVSQDTASNYQEVAISALSDDEYNVYSTEY